MLAVAGGKGGCGKTTTTLGLARAIARQGSEVIAVDADRAMPNLHAVAGVDREPGLPALESGAPLAAASHPLPANTRVQIVPAGAPTTDCVLTQALGQLPVDRPTLIDCPAGAGPAGATPLRHADRTLLVSTPSPASLCDAAKTAAMARTLGAPPIGVVLTRCETPPTGVEALLECDVIATINIDSDTKMANQQTGLQFDKLLKQTFLGNT